MPTRTSQLVLSNIYLVLIFADLTLMCGPGRNYGMRKSRKMTPLVFKQHVPNVSEFTLGASGPSEGRITKNDPRFKSLVVNNNPNIVFKDEEGTSRTGVVRIMSQRCKDKLDALAVLVKNHWPGVRLRVIEVWDEVGHGPPDSLHNEGRAVDVTTSDRDRSKYGMLARLAVNAGFDWVYYESRGHIHCSVRSDSSIADQMGGCFPQHSTVQLEDGRTIAMSQVTVGDRVLTVGPDSVFQYEPVIAFLHRSPNMSALVYVIETDGGHTLTLTPNHLLYVSFDVTADDFNKARATFASRLRDDDAAASYVYVTSSDTPRPAPKKVAKVTVAHALGLFAPLTASGNVVVDGVVTSCYAHVDSHVIAHLALAPLRIQHYVGELLRTVTSRGETVTQPVGAESNPDDGVHWYARKLFAIGRVVVPNDLWYASDVYAEMHHH